MSLLALVPWLSATLQQLIVQAARAREPELYAEVTFDNLPPGADVAQLKAFIERPDWWAQLQRFAPGVAPYEGWFTQYRGFLVDILAEELERLAPPPSPTPENVIDVDATSEFS